MESHLVLMLEQSWDLYMDPLMVIRMAILRDYRLEMYWGLLMVKCLVLMKASNWDILIVK